MKTPRRLFFALCLAAFLPPGLLPAQSPPAPDFEGFAFSWYTQPGKYPPTRTRTLCCPSKDKKWKKAVWKGHPYCDFLAENVDAYTAAGRTNLSMKVTPPPSGGRAAGAEIQSAGTFGYGSFRVHMATPARSNNYLKEGTSSAFYLRVPGKGEIGVEIRSKFQGLIGYKRGVADLVVRDFSAAPPRTWRGMGVLYFDPTTGFHSFGFDWRPGRVDFYADNSRLATLVSSTFPIPAGAGNLLLSHWTGDPSWTGGPPRDKNGKYVTNYMTVDWVSWTPVFFSAEPGEISLSAGGRADLRLQAGSWFAGKPYLVLSAFSEVSNPFDLGYVKVPLSPDTFTFTLFGMANSPVFPGFMGKLSAQGTAQASVLLPPGLSPLLKYRSLRFTCVSLDPARVFVTNPVLVQLVP